MQTVAPHPHGPAALIDRVLVLERAPGGLYPIRRFGDALAGLFGVDRSGGDFSGLFLAQDWRMTAALLTAVAEAGLPGLARFQAEAARGEGVTLDCAFLALPVEPGGGVLMIGAVTALTPVGEPPAVRLRVLSLHPPPAPTPPRLRLISARDL